MQKILYGLSIALVFCLTAGSTLSSCKNKKTPEETAPITPPSPSQALAPAIESDDDSLAKGVVDATKDFPSVQATVNDGVITLTGEISRARLTTLMQSLQSLRPKKIENNLTIK